MLYSYCTNYFVGHAQLVELDWVQDKLGADVHPMTLSDVTEGLFVEQVE
jgi:hypothetical protein